MPMHLGSLKDWIRLLRSRLSLRIVLWIFASIAVIEMILLVPSVGRRREEVLTQIENVSAGKVTWLMMTYPDADGEELLGHVQQLQADPMLQMVMGGAVYDAEGNSIGTFGEAPTLSFADARQGGSLYVQGAEGDRYDAAWVTAEPTDPHVIVIRHNADGTQAELIAYVLRILLLVLIIATFVTLVMMLILSKSLINPILKLRRDLAIAGQSICEDGDPPTFDSPQTQRNDELGEVIQTFEGMYGKICQAMAERKQAEAELRLNNEQMRQYLDQVDRVTAAAVALENQMFEAINLAEVAQREDELGKLACVFQEMAIEIQKREEKLRQQVRDLKIEIDEAKRQTDVATITESGYFQEVKEEINKLNLDEYWG
jgi:methyl-accepting chemotaxis protein